MTDASHHSLEALIARCEEEPVHAPGSIQPHGALVSLDPTHQRVLQASANLERWLGVPTATALQMNPRDLLGDEWLEWLEQADQAGVLSESDSTPCSATRSCGSQGRLVHVTAYRSGGQHVLEMEETAPAAHGELLAQLHHAIRSIQRAQSAGEVLERLVTQVRTLTGDDRVLVCRFDADGHGTVVAEDRSEHAISYLHHHFPASDIPGPVRRLYAVNPVRHIPQAQGVAVPLLTRDPASASSELDLSRGHLRGVAPIHQIYLQNMGVGAALSVALHDEDDLWGLVLCHAFQPRALEPALRDAVASLVHSAQTRWSLLTQRDEQACLRYARECREPLIQDIENPLHDPEALVRTHAPKWLELFRGCGAALLYRDQIHHFGQVPSGSVIQEISRRAWQKSQDKRARTPPSSTTRLADSELLAGRRVDEATPCGALVAPIPGFIEKTTCLLFFRPEQQQTRTWAGRLEKSVTTLPNGRECLSPRNSFAAWQEEIRGQSEPWTEVDHLAAGELAEELAVMLAARELQETDRIRRDFLAAVSHDLRTPLNAMIGATELLHETSLDPTQRDYVLRCQRAGDRLLTLIEMLLELSRIEAGHLRIQESAFEPGALLEQHIDLLEPRAQYKGITIHWDIAPDVPAVLFGDARLIGQIISNLLDNALKYTETGWIEVRADRCAPGWIRFRVTDTGWGIPEDEHATIFEEFTQSAHRKGDPGGLGLGLKICREVVHRLGGSITVASAPGAGASFSVELPLGEPPEPPGRTADAPAAYERPRAPSNGHTPDADVNVLVAEDDPTSAWLLQALLEKQGCRVDVAEDGHRALERTQSARYDLIFMDVNMPGRSGEDVVSAIRQRESAKDKPRTPIIAVSAHASDEVFARLLDAGCDDYITKPIRAARVRELLGSICGV